MLPDTLTVVCVHMFLLLCMRIFLLLQARQALNQTCTTWEDSPAMQALKQAVYGSASATASFSDLLYSASVQQVSCYRVLLKSMDTSLAMHGLI